MSISQEDVERSLTPAAGVLTAEIEHTAQLIGEDGPETTRRKLRAHLSQFYKATAKELVEREPPQHYRVVTVEQTGQRVIMAPLGGGGTPVCDGYILQRTKDDE